MKLFYGIFSLKCGQIIFRLFENINSKYIEMYSESVSFTDLDINSLKSFVSTIKNNLSLKLNNKKNKDSKISFAYEIDNEYAKENKIKLEVVKHYFDIASKVNENINVQIKQKTLSNSVFGSLKSVKTFLYEFEDLTGQVKQYASLPINKEGIKLTTFTSLMFFDNNSQIVEILNFLDQIGFKNENVYLQNQCLNNQNQDNKIKLIVSYDWENLTLSTVMNDAVISFENFSVNLEIFKKELAKRIKNNQLNILVNNSLQAVANNWNIFNMFDKNTDEYTIFSCLNNLISQCAKKVENHYKTVEMEISEIILYGQNNDFLFESLKNSSLKSKISLAEKLNKNQQANTIVINACKLLNNSKFSSENMLKTLNISQESKSRFNWFKKLFHIPSKPSFVKSIS
ncbi:MAG3720 family protein [Mycoplasmopsis felifaucium]|uniref:Uncharacterized protein n=1 Tax=Mycoplasmopsis felifaucium TaxID=35768 RepID=A0ABZ2RP41_9BACT